MSKAIVFDSQAKMKTSKYDASPTDEMRKNGYERLSVQFAGTFIGQAILLQFEKMLWSLEKTASWIPNGKTVGRKGKASAGLVRPLPWIVFLPTLIMLRCARIILSLAAICLGFDEIEASTMVTYLHNARRYFRKIRRDVEPHRSSQQENRSFYPEIIGKALVNGISSVCAWPLSREAKVQNNKTLLDLNSDDIVENGSNASDDSTTDSEDQEYRELLTRSFPESEESDEDYTCEQGSSADASESSHNENSFYEEGEIEALKEDVKRYNGREIVLETNEPKTNERKSNEPKTNGDKNHDLFQNDTQPAISGPIEPSHDASNQPPQVASDQPSPVNVTPNNHTKDNGKKPLKLKGKHIKKK